MKFCDKLNKLLAEKEMRPIDLVNATDIGKSNVHYLVTGRSKNPTLHTLFEISDALDITMDELLKDVDVPENTRKKTQPVKE